MNKSVIVSAILAASINANAQQDVNYFGSWILYGAPNLEIPEHAHDIEKRETNFVDIPGAEWLGPPPQLGLNSPGTYLYYTGVQISHYEPRDYCLHVEVAGDNVVSTVKFDGAEGYIPSGAGPKNTVSSRTDVSLRGPRDYEIYVTVESYGNYPGTFIGKFVLEPGQCNEPITVVETPVGIETDQNVWRLPVAGDWDCDGIATVGWYQRYIGRFVLWNSNDYAGKPDVVFHFGPKRARWLPIVGDWDGDGCDEIGVYNPWQQVFHLRYDLTTGQADEVLRREKN